MAAAALPSLPAGPAPGAGGLVRAELDGSTQTGREIIADAKYHDIALRIIRSGGHIRQTELAAEVGLAPATVGRVLKSLAFQEVYRNVEDEVHGNIDKRIANERGDTLMRSSAIRTRAMTLVGELAEASRRELNRAKAGEVPLRAGMVKAATDVAAEMRMIAKEAAEEERGGRSVEPIKQVTINIDNRRAVMMQDAIKEAGVDISDLLRPAAVDAEIVDEGV